MRIELRLNKCFIIPASDSIASLSKILIVMYTDFLQNQDKLPKNATNQACARVNLSHWLILVMSTEFSTHTQRADNPGQSVLSSELPVSSNEIYNRYSSHCPRLLDTKE